MKPDLADLLRQAEEGASLRDEEAGGMKERAGGGGGRGSGEAARDC